MTDVRELVEEEVSGWAGVEVRPHRFGGMEFRVRGHEIGHLHGSRTADLPFPIRMRKELVAQGKAEPHHLLPQTGWVSYYPSGPESAPALVELFRLNYERLVERGKNKAEKAVPRVVADGVPDGGSR